MGWGVSHNIVTQYWDRFVASRSIRSIGRLSREQKGASLVSWFNPIACLLSIGKLHWIRRGIFSCTSWSGTLFSLLCGYGGEKYLGASGWGQSWTVAQESHVAWSVGQVRGSQLQQEVGRVTGPRHATKSILDAPEYFRL